MEVASGGVAGGGIVVGEMRLVGVCWEEKDEERS